MLPDLRTVIPGPESQRLAGQLREAECQNVTYLGEDWPVFWERAEGVNVWDVDGNRYLDFTSAFGVCGLGHRNAEVVKALHRQADQLLHGMGDVHPTALKGELCAALSMMTFQRWGAGRGKVTLTNSGFEAIEAALKTAVLKTGRRGIIAFERGYHGLGYGSLLGTDLAKFRGPFGEQLAEVTQRWEFGKGPEGLEPGKIGAVLVEPFQGRGGKRPAPEGFLQAWREWCDEYEVVLIFDEIYTGFWRTGKMFACEWDGVIPDVICVGKAMSSGFPISACVGKAQIMDAWPKSPGEALHTSTFLGHPVGCAMALKSLEIHQREATREMVARTGEALERALQPFQGHPAVRDVRGRGLMWGVEMMDSAGAFLGPLLAEGLLFLADGPEGKVLAFSPPFAVSEEEIAFATHKCFQLLKS